MSSFENITDPLARREAQLFIAGTLTGSNIAVVILHGLVAKGVFTNEVARALLDDAHNKCAKFELPAGYEEVMKHVFDNFKVGFADGR